METKTLTASVLVHFDHLKQDAIIQEYVNSSLEKEYYTQSLGKLEGATDFTKALARVVEENLFPKPRHILQPSWGLGGSSGASGVASLMGTMGTRPLEDLIKTLKEFPREDLPLLIGFFKNERMQDALAKVLSGEYDE